MPGNGRQGATNSGTPTAFTGTSGLGIEYPAQINNSGIIDVDMVAVRRSRFLV